MRPRLPSLRPFSVGTGLFAGVCAGLLAHHLAPGVAIPDLGSGPGVGLAPAVGFLVLLGVWVALEQVPEAVDRLLLARGHYALGAFALCPALAVLVVDATGAVALAEATRVQALVVALVGLAATSAATGQRARLLREREAVELAVEAVEVRRRRLAVTAASFVVFYAGFAAVYPAVFSVASFVGMAIGLGVGAFVVGERRVDLTVLDRGLLVGASGHLGASLVAWQRVHSVTVDGDTLTVRRGLPWPLVYRVDLGESDDRNAVVETLRARVDGR
ncbi:hypothetical protein N0B31_11525 [Salinirubellus salinus]|uniref:Uncharacterized protein n=1 Tax=Salinirubellus salinus TaxID=1364945 RepID=A0A9E7QZE2_9EURY|nr:hypothetical protein [Salinirubellus salinus]UWM52782.1 hypothetical protein N0B31_11525 [Salinirubellus salinus]